MRSKHGSDAVGDFAQELLLRSAVERQFEIIGEALSQLAKSHPEIAAKVPDLP